VDLQLLKWWLSLSDQGQKTGTFRPTWRLLAEHLLNFLSRPLNFRSCLWASLTILACLWLRGSLIPIIWDGNVPWAMLKNKITFSCPLRWLVIFGEYPFPMLPEKLWSYWTWSSFSFAVCILLLLFIEDMHSSCSCCLLSVHILSLSIPTREIKVVM